jgi:DNA recombination protein RmuC
LGVAGDKEKLAIEYPDAPADVRELSNPELENADDYIDVEIVEE